MRKRSKSGLQRKVLVSLVCGSALMFYVGTGVALAAEEPSHEIIVNDKNIGDWQGNNVDATNIKTTETGAIVGIATSSYSGNTVTINFTDTSKSVNGVYGARGSDGAKVEQNQVTITGGSIGGNVSGGDASNGAATENTVTITGGTIGRDVSGGNTRNGAVIGNTVTIEGGTIRRDVFGGGANGGDAASNTVKISGTSEVKGSVYGGKANGGAATKNTVTITGGGIIGGNVYGGYSVTMDNSAEAAVPNNTVNLLAGDYTFGAGTIIAGSGHDEGITGDFITGNTLNVYRSGIEVKGVENFAKYNFYLPTDLEAGSTILTVTNGVDLSGSEVGVGVQTGGASPLKKGNKVNLIATADTITAGDLTNNIEGMEGISKKYTFGLALSEDKKTLTAEVLSGGGMAEQTKSLVETRLAASALINKGGDMLADQGLASAKAAAEQGSYNVFATAGGDSMRYNTGSHVDSKSYHLQGGFARTLASGTGTLTIAPLIEYGNGSYDSYLNDGVHASGDMHYWGLGFLARQDNADGFYYEGSIRGGKVGSDYKSHDLVGADEVTYDVSVPYYALHLGVGQVQTLSEQNTLDYYGKYFYSHQGGDSAALSSGEVYDFESVNSNRVRLGTRFTHEANTLSKLYAGVAWEYEFSGSAEASYQGDKTLSPSLKGASGMLELGWQGKASSTSAMTADISVTGWTGQQKGVAFKAGLNWGF